ncbi:hypothetical protein GCM10020254_85000 [Streptomyces goshikiensis]
MYAHPDDLHRARSVGANAPAEFAAWVAFQKAVDREDGAVPRRYRELISVAVALVTQCSYCLDVHTAAARRHGVTPRGTGRGRLRDRLRTRGRHTRTRFARRPSLRTAHPLLGARPRLGRWRRHRADQAICQLRRGNRPTLPIVGYGRD